MSEVQLKKVEDLIPLSKGCTIIKQKAKRLTAPGENYGSLMLSADITIQTPDGIQEIHAAVKMIPPNDFLQEVFQSQVSFRNEIGFYKIIAPLLQNFQREHGVQNVVDFAPKYYGSRLNLNNDENSPVDSDAALVLENLKVRNFSNLNRFDGFDFDVAKFVITDLAYLHAIPLAIKLKRPETFEKEIKPYFRPWQMKEKMHADTEKHVVNMIASIDELKNLQDRVLTGFRKMYAPPQPREPFATIAHNDFWLNNNMVKMEDGKPVKNKIVDFQVFDYGSPGKDIIFFLFSSVKNSVIEEHYDELVRAYHKTFIEVLQELDCDTRQFSFEAFLKELDHEAENTQFGHLAFMIFPIFTEEAAVPDIDQMTREQLKNKRATALHKEKFKFVVKQFAKRNWI